MAMHHGVIWYWTFRAQRFPLPVPVCTHHPFLATSIMPIPDVIAYRYNESLVYVPPAQSLKVCSTVTCIMMCDL